MMAKLVRKLIPGIHYRADEYERNVFLTEAGVEHAEALAGCGNLYDAQNYELLTGLNCALHAEALLKKDVDYIVRNRRIELVDEFTGRIADKRHWPDGLQAGCTLLEPTDMKAAGLITS